MKRGDLQLDIIGDGPQRAALEAMVDQLAITDHVHFHGWVEHSRLQETLGACDFLALPSVREFGGAVVVEAMALGITPVVANYAGPSELVDAATGIRVDFHDKQSLVDGFRQAIGEIIHSPAILEQLGSAARVKIRQKLTWGAKAKQITEVYAAVLRHESKLNLLGYQ